MTTSVYTDTTVSWNTNVTYKLDKKGQVAHYSVTFYEGLVTEDELADAQSAWETTVDGVDGDGAFINSVVIPGDLLKEISADAVPAYTVAVSCDHPDYPGQTLLTLAPIITQAKPVVPRFETLDTYFITDSDESIQDGKRAISWRFENGDTINGVTYSYTVVKNN